MSAVSPAAPALAPEDAARAAFYGLIARLCYAAPDSAVLAQIVDANAFEGDSPVARAWAELVAASRTAFPVMLEQEHTDLLVGTGKAEVTPYLTHYTIKYATDNPLVGLRQRLASWGLGRRETAHEPEDHIAGIFETMRFAIAVQQRSFDEQKDFFETFLYRGAIGFCDAVNASPKSVFYKPVAGFTRAFVELEHNAFEIA
jgi:TorA maturation chaperone TorD